MKIARKTLMIIGFIVSIFLVIILAILVAIMFRATGTEENVQEILDKLKINIKVEDGKYIVMGIGIGFSFLALLVFINAIISIKGAQYA